MDGLKNRHWLRWRQANPDAPTALALDYLNMAGAIYLNGTLLARAEHLAEPLTRMWNLPRYLLLPAPMLRAGVNTLDVRVSGMAMYQAGLGPATPGDPAPMRARVGRAFLIRYRVQWIGMIVTVTLASFSWRSG